VKIKRTLGFYPKKGLADKLFANGHWLDAFRFINQEAEQNTWWSNRGQKWWLAHRLSNSNNKCVQL
jgi:exonuclease III